MSWAKPDEAARWQREFGYRLRSLREEAGLTQMALAHKADLDVTYVSSVERGRRNLSLVNILVLAKALGTTGANLLGDVGQGRPSPKSAAR